MRPSVALGYIAALTVIACLGYAYGVLFGLLALCAFVIAVVGVCLLSVSAGRDWSDSDDWGV